MMCVTTRPGAVRWSLLEALAWARAQERQVLLTQEEVLMDCPQCREPVNPMQGIALGGEQYHPACLPRTRGRNRAPAQAAALALALPLGAAGCTYSATVAPLGRPPHVHTAACRPRPIVSTPASAPRGSLAGERPPVVRFLDPVPSEETPPPPPAPPAPPIEAQPVPPAVPLPLETPLPEPTPASPAMAPGGGRHRVLQARAEGQEGGQR